MTNESWIMFDKDGTLIHFDKSWVKIGIQLVEAVCDYFHIDDREAVKADLGIVNDAFTPGSIMASGTLDEMITVFNQYAEQDTTRFTQQKSQALIDTREPEVVFIDGVIATLKELKSAGYRLGILTSDNRTGMEYFFERTQLQHLFDSVISTNGDNFEKPDPRILEPLWNQGVKGEHLIIVGDTDNDMKTGKNAQARYTVGVRTGLGNQAKFDDADIVLKDVTALPKFLSKETH